MITCLATYSPVVINCIIPPTKPNCVYCTNIKITSDEIIYDKYPVFSQISISSFYSFHSGKGTSQEIAL